MLTHNYLGLENELPVICERLVAGMKGAGGQVGKKVQNSHINSTSNQRHIKLVTKFTSKMKQICTKSNAQIQT